MTTAPKAPTHHMLTNGVCFRIIVRHQPLGKVVPRAERRPPMDGDIDTFQDDCAVTSPLTAGEVIGTKFAPFAIYRSSALT